MFDKKVTLAMRKEYEKFKIKYELDLNQMIKSRFKRSNAMTKQSRKYETVETQPQVVKKQ